MELVGNNRNKVLKVIKSFKKGKKNELTKCHDREEHPSGRRQERMKKNEAVQRINQ